MTTSTFPQLVAARQAWIRDVLQPWCRAASFSDLQQAEQEWLDIAGRPDPQHTLWLWAWSRFPCLYEDGLPALEETFEVEVTLQDGGAYVGYPDAASSKGGLLVLIGRGEDNCSAGFGPFRIDQITAVRRTDPTAQLLRPADADQNRGPFFMRVTRVEDEPPPEAKTMRSDTADEGGQTQ